MTKQNKMTFEEWWNTRHILDGENMFWKTETVEAWVYQQKEIDKLQEENRVLKEKISQLDWQYRELIKRRKQVRVAKEVLKLYPSAKYALAKIEEIGDINV